jgi:hypothetical protein
VTAQKSEVSVSLEVLRKTLRPVDFAPYEAKAGAPEWLRGLGRIAKANFGVLALMRPIAVSVAVDRTNSRRATVDTVSLYIAGLGDLVRNSDHRLAVGLPPAGRHIPLLLAVTSVLSQALQPHGQEGTTRSGVLVITPNLDIRSRYCDLLFRGHALDDEFPGSRLRPDGTRVMLRGTSRPADSGICFFLPPLNLPTRIDFHPALIILDVRYAQWTPRAEALAQWAAAVDKRAGVIGLYTICDLETLNALTSAHYTDLPIDHAAVAACTAYTRHLTVRRSNELMDWTLAASPEYLDRDHQIAEISDALALEQLFRDVATLLNEHREADNTDLKRARWILATLAQMPVPVLWYDEAARSLGRRPIKRLIERLGVFSRHEDNLAHVVQTVRLGLIRIHESLERSNPRAALLKQRVVMMAETHHGTPILLLVRDHTTERAARNWLAFEACAGAAWLPDLNVVACPNYARSPMPRFKAALVNGVLPRRYRWIAGSALADTVTFITYQQESNIVEAQLGAVYGKVSLDARAAQRSLALTGASAGHNLHAASEDRGIPPLRLARPTHPASATGPRKPVRIPLEQLAQEWQRLQSATAPPPEPETPAKAIWEEDAGGDDTTDEQAPEPRTAGESEPAECLRLTVNSRANGKGTIWLPPDLIVELIRPSAGDEESPRGRYRRAMSSFVSTRRAVDRFSTELSS